MYRKPLWIGIVLMLASLPAVVVSLGNGPSSWSVSGETFWGMPICLFVFWIGIAHAGTLISAVFLALGISLDRRTSLVAELSTIGALAVAVLFPLLHLGVLENFYMVAPLLDARRNLSNVRSPLVWDFCCIAVYGVLSLVYFVIHLLADRKRAFENLRKPMAWLLFPLVLWVHTIVSLDFAVTFVPSWRGSFFPLYFIVGAVYSGLAMVIVLLSIENCRLRLLEKLLTVCSWLMFAFWVWNFALKGEFFWCVVILGALVPQLWWIADIRESAWGRLLVPLSVMTAMMLERVYLVLPPGTIPEGALGWVDFGLAVFAVSLFAVLFSALRLKLGTLIEGDGIVFGEVDEAAPAVAERRVEPFASHEFITLRFPLLLGVMVSLAFLAWVCRSQVNENVLMGLANVFPLFYPLVALVAAFALCFRPFKSLVPRRARRWLILPIALVGFLLGAFYAGGVSEKAAGETRAMQGEVVPARVVWESRCASCHGLEGRRNARFVPEFYPVPQELTLSRVDSLGEDSLVRVILEGRVNMSAYGGRLKEDEARGLARYMRRLAGEEP